MATQRRVPQPSRRRRAERALGREPLVRLVRQKQNARTAAAPNPSPNARGLRHACNDKRAASRRRGCRRGVPRFSLSRRPQVPHETVANQHLRSAVRVQDAGNEPRKCSRGPQPQRTAGTTTARGAVERARAARHACSTGRGASPCRGRGPRLSATESAYGPHKTGQHKATAAHPRLPRSAALILGTGSGPRKCSRGVRRLKNARPFARRKLPRASAAGM